jgi:porphobilinogen deaminase
VPIAGHAEFQSGKITMRGLVANLAGTVVVEERISGSADTNATARELGIKLGKQLVERGAGDILAEISQRGASR